MERRKSSIVQIKQTAQIKVNQKKKAKKYK